MGQKTMSLAVHQLDDRFGNLVSEGAEVTVLLDDLESTTEGPVWLEAEGCLVFSEIGLVRRGAGIGELHGGRRFRCTPDGKIALDHEPTSNTNGMTLDNEGRLINCQLGDRRVCRWERDGSLTVLASHYRGMRFSAPNDVVVARDGAIYFTDTAGLWPGGEVPFSAAYRIAPDLSSVDLVAKGLQLANGLVLSLDERVLYVNDSEGISHNRDHPARSQGTIRAYDVRQTGMLSNDRLFAELRGELSGVPDGMAVDSEGNVYSTGPGGIWAFDAEGTHLGTLLFPAAQVTNFCWGGPDLKTLYVTAFGSLFCLETRVAGAPVGPRP
jgi:gluconolactonase